MDSQSSFTMAFRAIVMLSCLILVPLVALFGTTLPETIKRIVQRQLDANTASAAPTFTEPYCFVPAGNPAPVSQPTGATVAPMALPAMAASPIPTVSPQPMAGANGFASPSPSGVVPAGYTAPVPAQPMAGAPGSDTIRAAAAMGMGAGAAGVDRFTYLKDRLRELGANYYLLETWGNQGQLFRFYCKVAVGGSVNYGRYFEATDADPLRAMAGVLEQVEAWRSARP